MTQKQANVLRILRAAQGGRGSGLSGQQVARSLDAIERRPVYYDAAHGRLARLEWNGLVTSWPRTENGVRRSYWHITNKGIEEIASYDNRTARR